MTPPPFIVGLGGTTRIGSTSELALRYALGVAKAAGARVELVAGPALELPQYDPANPHRPPAARRLIQVVRAADGIILSTPSYHGSLSGMIKNALDYIEDLRSDRRPYFEGRAVGCIVCAHGVQALGTSLIALRSVIHSLRGWPTPYAATLLSSESPFVDGQPADDETGNKLAVVSRQVVEFATMRARMIEARESEYDALREASAF